MMKGGPMYQCVRRLRASASLGLTLALLGCASLLVQQVRTEAVALKGGAYSLDKTHATLLWKVSHLGFSSFVGRFNDFDATLDFDPEQPEASKLAVVIRAASLDVGQPEFEKELRGKDWFDTASHPEIRFVSTTIEVTGENTGRVTGDLTFLGRTKPVTLDVTFNGGAENFVSGKFTLGFQAAAVVKRTEFGMTNLAPKIVGPDVTLEIHVEFVRNN